MPKASRLFNDIRNSVPPQTFVLGSSSDSTHACKCLCTTSITSVWECNTLAVITLHTAQYRGDSDKCTLTRIKLSVQPIVALDGLPANTVIAAARINTNIMLSCKHTCCHVRILIYTVAWSDFRLKNCQFVLCIREPTNYGCLFKQDDVLIPVAETPSKRSCSLLIFNEKRQWEAIFLLTTTVQCDSDDRTSRTSLQ